MENTQADKKEVFFCFSCNEAIKYGFIIAGNIYSISNYNENGGIIGNNFNSDGTLGNQNALCHDCFVRLLNKVRVENDTKRI